MESNSTSSDRAALAEALACHYHTQDKARAAAFGVPVVLCRNSRYIAGFLADATARRQMRLSSKMLVSALAFGLKAEVEEAQAQVQALLDTAETQEALEALVPEIEKVGERMRDDARLLEVMAQHAR